MGKLQLNTLMEGYEELYELIVKDSAAKHKTLRQWAIDAFKLALGFPVEQQQPGVSLQAIDERIEATLDYKLLEIKDSLASKLEGMLEEKLKSQEMQGIIAAELSEHVVSLVNKLSGFKSEYNQDLSQMKGAIAHLHTQVKALSNDDGDEALYVDQRLTETWNSLHELAAELVDNRLAELKNQANNRFDQMLDAKLAALTTHYSLLTTNQPASNFPAASATASETSQPFSQRKLAARLGVDQETVMRHRNKPDFEEWTRSRDPEGKAWRFEDGKFVAQSNYSATTPLLNKL